MPHVARAAADFLMEATTDAVMYQYSEFLIDHFNHVGLGRAIGKDGASAPCGVHCKCGTDIKTEILAGRGFVQPRRGYQIQGSCQDRQQYVSVA